MPEGHLLHRFAREQSADLAGEALAVSSPQGRFDPTPVDGRVLERAEAHGKHLLYRFGASPSSGAADAPTVHVHLGMRGLFLRHPDPSAPPRPSARLRLTGTRAAYDLIAPTRCEVLNPAQTDALLAGLGPDPLQSDAGSPAVEDEAVRRVRATRAAVGAALLDQAVWAGLGNAWRAELLYLARIDPALPAAALEEEQARRLWREACRLMELGAQHGLVVSDPDAPDERWVYKRETCRGCGAPVRAWQLGGRTSYACTAEQAAVPRDAVRQK